MFEGDLAPLSQLLPFWPEEVFGPADFLDDVGLVSYRVDGQPPELRADGRLVLLRPLELAMPLWGAFRAVLSHAEGEETIPIAFELHPRQRLSMTGLALSLLFDSDLARPAERDEHGRWRIRRDENGTPLPFALELGRVEIEVEAQEDVVVRSPSAAQLEPIAIGQSGLVLELESLRTHLADSSEMPRGFRGLSASRAIVHLPPTFDVPLPANRFEIEDLAIGSTGLSGRIQLMPAPPPVFDAQERTFHGEGAGELAGLAFSLERLEIELRQSVIATSEIGGQVALPFFDMPLGVDIEIGEGVPSISLSPQQPGGLVDGRVVLRREGLLELEIAAAEIEVEAELITLGLSGKLKPLLAGVDWPVFDLRRLKIDSSGHVMLEDGVLELDRPRSLDFFGFTVEIRALDFGTAEDGRSFLALHGSVGLAAGLPAAASVDGLRILWGRGAPELVFDGIAVRLEMPGALKLAGALAFDRALRRFSGSIALELPALDLHIDGIAVAERGSFGVHVALDLPSGIPLWSTGLGIYGLSGMLALGLEPARGPGEDWPEWYRGQEHGLVDLARWRRDPKALGLGAGLRLGTLADNGFAFGSQLTLVLLFPGPVLFLEGRASLLSDDDEGALRAVAVLDGEAATFSIGLDAAYQYPQPSHPAPGALVDLSADGEFFFSFLDPLAWHLDLGREEPRERRIRARIFSLFNSDAYLALRPSHLALGAWTGWDENWRFGPLRATLEAWIDGRAALSWAPVHFHGSLWLHGRVALRAFGVGIGLSIDAGLDVDVLEPFHLLASLRARLEMPWPIDDFSVELRLEWGPERSVPELPLPILEQAAVEHFKATTAWPLRLSRWRQEVVGPDSNTSRSESEVAAGAPPPSSAPVVPLDGRVHLSFRHSVHDDAIIGDNAQRIAPAWQRIGDPAKDEGPMQVRYSLVGSALARWDVVEEAWLDTATGGELAAGMAPEDEPPEDLFGSWAPLPSQPLSLEKAPDSRRLDPAVSQTKLWLWSKTPFARLRSLSGSWDETFADRFTGYPCIEGTEQEPVCHDFHRFVLIAKQEPVFASPAEPRFLVQGFEMPGRSRVSPELIVDDNIELMRFRTRLRLSDTGAPIGFIPLWILIELPTPVERVELTLTAPQATLYQVAPPDHWRLDAVPSWLPVPARRLSAADRQETVVFDGEPISALIIDCHERADLFGLCYGSESSVDLDRRRQLARRVSAATDRWSRPEALFEPDTHYRLAVACRAQSRGEGPLDGHQQQWQRVDYAFFRTEGAPGLADLSDPRPGDQSATAFQSPLDDLTHYVEHTLPRRLPILGGLARAARPFYRAYDLGVAFNEDYVESLYTLAGRDLGLRLVDAAGRPARDAAGLLIPPSFRWRGSETEAVLSQPRVDRGREQLAHAIEVGGCGEAATSLAPSEILDGSQVRVLRPEERYTARLVPMLMHENFERFQTRLSSDGRSEGFGWTIDHRPGPASFAIWGQLSALEEDDPHFGRPVGQIAQAPSEPPLQIGSMLIWTGLAGLTPSHQENPHQWSDYRLSAILRAEGGRTGLVFRHRANEFYRFSRHRRLDQMTMRLEKIRAIDPQPVVLWQEESSSDSNLPVFVAIESVAAAITLFINGRALITLQDPEPLLLGTVGLYSADLGRDDTARFYDLRVDDLRPSRKAVFSFDFITSRFANFAHHMHSYRDEIWRIDLEHEPRPDAAQIEEWLELASAASSPDPTTAEMGACESILQAVWGAEIRRSLEGLEISRLDASNHALAWVILSPEPFDWRRLGIRLDRVETILPAATPPRTVKLIDVVPETQSITLLVLQNDLLGGYRIESRALGQRDWLPWLDIESEHKLASGQVVTVSGPSLPLRGVELRILAPSGQSEHQRVFLPHQAFTPLLSPRILRRRDGTALILAPSSNEPMPRLRPGHHRLHLSFARDLRAEDPTQERWSENGNRSPESVLIDLPWEIAESS